MSANSHCNTATGPRPAAIDRLEVQASFRQTDDFLCLRRSRKTLLTPPGLDCADGHLQPSREFGVANLSYELGQGRLHLARQSTRIVYVAQEEDTRYASYAA